MMWLIQEKYSRLPKENRDEEVLDNEIARPRRFNKSWTTIHLTLISIYTTVFLVVLFRVPQAAWSQKKYSPAESAARYERKTFQGGINYTSKYRGYSRPELEEAWHKIIQHTNVRVSANDLRKINRTSIRLQEGSGDYLVSLDVFHQLHCLKYVGDVIQFGTNETERLPEHLDHCLDSIRQLIMCKADVSLMTFDWREGYRKPWPNFEVAHDCRNFEEIDEWASRHHVDMFEEGMIVHPTLGNPFPADEHGHTDMSGLIPGLTMGGIITPPVV